MKSIFKFGSTITHNRLVDQSSKFVSLGLEDQHIHHKHYDSYETVFENQLKHSRFSHFNTFLDDPYTLTEEQDPLAQLPHGYIFYEDPFDNRNNLNMPIIHTCFAGFFLFVFGNCYGYYVLWMEPHYEGITRLNVVRNDLEDLLDVKRQEYQEIKKELEELRQQKLK